MVPAARRAAVQTGPQIAPALYQRAAFYGLTNPQVPATAKTSAQIQVEELQRKNARRQAIVGRWAEQNRVRKDLEAQKLTTDRLNNRTWVQRATGPRTLGTGLMRPASSPFGGTGMARPTTIGVTGLGQRSFSSAGSDAGNLGSPAYAQALENYNNGKTLEEINLAFNPKQPEQPTLFSKLFGGTPQPKTPSQSESLILFIKKIFEIREDGDLYILEFPREYSSQFPTGRSLTSQFSPQDIATEGKLIDSIITGNVQQKYNSAYAQAEHLAESSPTKGLTKNESLYFELMKNVLQGKALEADHFKILQAMAKSLAHDPQKTLDVIIFWEKTVEERWSTAQKEYEQSIMKDFLKDIELYKNGQFIVVEPGGIGRNNREFLYSGSKATQKMAEKWAIAPEEMYQPVHNELMEIMRNSNRDWLAPQTKKIKSNFRFHDPNKKSTIQHPTAQMTQEEIIKQFQENFEKYKNGEISFAEMIITYHPDQAFNSSLWRLYEDFTDAIIKQKYE